MSGNRTNMTTLEGTNAYTYDARNWLTSAVYPDGRTQQFTYDPVGNRTRLDDSGIGVSPVLYSYDAANRLLTDIAGTTTNLYTYDNAGRLISQTVGTQARSYSYSFRSQMTSLTDTNAAVFSYEFDGDGNRTKQSLNNCLSSRYVYDGPNVVLELNASNEVVHAYVNGLGIDQPIERIAFAGGSPPSTLNSRLVYHTDGLGSVVALTDSGQQIAKSYSYEAFGKIRSETGNALIANRYTYTSRESLGDTLGFMYYRWRVMDPNVGRFTSEDPLGFVDGVNNYLYVGNGPTANTDPEGLSFSSTVGSFASSFCSGIGSAGPMASYYKACCAAKGGKWQQHFETLGYSSAKDCMNDLWKKATGTPPLTTIGVGLLAKIKKVLKPIAVGLTIGKYSYGYWCCSEGCDLDIL